MITQLLDSDSSWSKFSQGVKLAESFSTYKEAIEFALEEDLAGKNASNVSEMIASFPDQHSSQNTADSSVGGNDAINPYWQFGIDDDIVHPLTSIDGIQASKGMGRVYSENYNKNQQILWLSMGVPKFCKLDQFYTDAGSSDMANLMKTGDLTASKALKLGAFLGSAGKLAFELPFLPIIWMHKLAKYITTGPSVTKYYDFKPAQILYYRMANTILSQLAVSMGIYGNGGEDKYESSGLPSIMEDGPDIFAIMNKRAKRFTGKVTTTDDLIADLAKEEGDKKWYDVFTGGLTGSITGAHDYIGFKIERSTDASETISNSTGPSSIVESLNGASAGIRDKKFALAGGTGITILDSAISSVKDLVTGVASSILGGGTVAVMAGNGFFDIPDVWKDSSFSKSYTFNVQLRSRYGDPVSIYQSIYIPLAMWLAAALPRGLGNNKYTSPFLIRGYSRGKFAIPLGIIESLTIKRGLPEFGWSSDSLPTAVDISVNIKDLSPAMFLNLTDESLAKGLIDAFSRNDSFNEYVSTLSGLGLYERTDQWKTIQNKIKATGLMKKNTLTSPLYWGMVLGAGTLPRALGRISPWKSNIPNN